MRTNRKLTSNEKVLIKKIYEYFPTLFTRESEFKESATVCVLGEFYALVTKDDFLDYFASRSWGSLKIAYKIKNEDRCVFLN